MIIKPLCEHSFDRFVFWVLCKLNCVIKHKKFHIVYICYLLCKIHMMTADGILRAVFKHSFHQQLYDPDVILGTSAALCLIRFVLNRITVYLFSYIYILSHACSYLGFQTECERYHFSSTCLEVPTRCESKSLGCNKFLRGTSGDEEVEAESKTEGQEKKRIHASLWIGLSSKWCYYLPL